MTVETYSSTWASDGQSDIGKDSCGVGFVTQIKNQASHQIVEWGLEILENLAHRGACGCESNTGDGAGILLQIPDRFFRRVMYDEQKITLPPPQQYGVGSVFFPTNSTEFAQCEKIIETIIHEEGQQLLGWRDVPISASNIGPTALSSQPIQKQVFVKNVSMNSVDNFERKLFVIRKRIEKSISRLSLKQNHFFYICSFSCRTIVYKGMLTPLQLRSYFPDLVNNEDFESALALVHSRFSTNTFPSWNLSHPFRYLAHNGEINTLRGNINAMHAREALLECDLFTKEEIKHLLPIVREFQSDSATLDNVLEFLVMTGRTLPHAIMMLIPEAWNNDSIMSQYKKDFYHFHASLMEPWDGPASVAFTDGRVIGAVLDRNGLRPSRYWVTQDDLVIMASEVGVLNIPQNRILKKGRLEPGKMFLVDLIQGEIVDDGTLKEKIAQAHPYGEWLRNELIRLEQLPTAVVPVVDHASILKRQRCFNYTQEDLRLILAPMVNTSQEAIGSMGDDAALAVLSEKPQLLFNYFKQLFAQVTNPPLDAIREELVTSMTTTIGPEGNLLIPTPESCRQIELKNPILDNDEMAKLIHLNHKQFKSKVIPILFRAADQEEGLQRSLDEIFQKASEAIQDGYQILILSDRGINDEWVPIPSLLAISGLHHYLIRKSERTKVGIALESGEPREVHHFSLLLGYGANAINPYLALETLDDMIRRNILSGVDHKIAVKNYLKAANKGIIKTMSKMGISTVQSYRGAQIFEAIGLKKKFIDHYFTWTPSRIEGIGLEEIAHESLLRHAAAFNRRDAKALDLDLGGKYQWRRGGEQHLFNPTTIHKLHFSTRSNNYKVFKEYSRAVNNTAKNLCTFRALVRFKKRTPIPISDVEPASEIVKRFATGAMSYGSISYEAHSTLAIAMNRLGGKSNTGEGGEDEERFSKNAQGDSANSAIKQVASGRFGVTSHYLVNAKEIQIKMAQGAKPGEGGQLPGSKVYPWIAKTRHSTPFVQLISPPPHHDIYSIEDLAQLIHDLKNANRFARISVKLVAECGVGTIAAGVSKAHADHILISGHDGGTGASPLTSIKYAGIPWELGLSEAHSILVKNQLRDRVVVQVDGQLKTGRDVVIGALLGAEEFGFATTALVVEGCVMMRVCHLDTCPVGIATQNPELRKRFTGKPEYVQNFMMFIAEEVREIMAELGFKTIQEMIGHSEILEVNPELLNWKTKNLDFSDILSLPKVSDQKLAYCTQKQDHGLELSLDNSIINQCQDAINNQKPVQLEMPIRNINRTVGTMLGAEISRRYGKNGLADDTIQITFKGSGGQSFGAFVPRGVTMRLEGDANDYVGKGLCGGKIIVYPPREARFRAEENIIVGNVLCYGATGGEVYIRGKAGERFCVRNSGVHAIVEGVGDHGCEYMTAGRVVVLGEIGRNFAAGMSGGIAYIWNKMKNFELKCNLEMIEIEPQLDPQDLVFLKQIIQKHFEYTRSSVAEHVLKNWEEEAHEFKKIMPIEYKRIQMELQKTMSNSGVPIA